VDGQNVGVLLAVSAASEVVNSAMALAISVGCVAGNRWLGYVDRHPPSKSAFLHRHWVYAKRTSGFRHLTLRVSAALMAAVSVALLLYALLIAAGVTA
jgi:hypothetical protein